MAGIVFSHSNPTVGSLSLRLPPTSVQWDYNLNTQQTNTYGGQVVQILSVNFGQVVIEGQFGKEGPHGAVIQNGALVKRPVSEFTDLGNTSTYAIGLTQMTEYFKRYFTISSAGDGGDPTTRGAYNQQPMSMVYSSVIDVNVDTNMSESEWLVYPVEMPSYARSNDNFAPKWQVTCEVYQAPSDITSAIQQSATQTLSNLREETGYTPSNIFSDPDGIRIPFLPKTEELTNAAIKELQQNALTEFNQTLSRNVSTFTQNLPAYTTEDLTTLLMGGASGPTGS